MKLPTAAEARKALVVLVAFVAQLVSLGVLPGSVEPYVAAVVTALAAVGVYVVPNASKADKAATPAA